MQNPYERQKNTIEPLAMIQIPNKFPQTGVLTNHMIQTTNMKDYVWLEKTDGKHYNIQINAYGIYSLKDGRSTLEIKKKDIKIKGDSILDCELYEDIYYVFDCSLVESVDVSKWNYLKRMEYLKAIYLPSRFKIKEYYPVTSWGELIHFVNHNTISPVTGNKIDGVVCQRTDLEYFRMSAFKMKRPAMNTIDFLLKRHGTGKETRYNLYVYGSIQDLMANRKRMPKINNESAFDVGIDLRSKELPNELPFLFCSPYEEGLHKFIPRKNWMRDEQPKEQTEEPKEQTEEPKELEEPKEISNQSSEKYKESINAVINSPEKVKSSNPLVTYTEEEIEQINKLMRTDLDGKIVEMSLSPTGWVPIRIRKDKEYPNGFSTALSNCGLLFSPLTDQSGYFAKKFAFGEEVISPYHEISVQIRKNIIENILNPLALSFGTCIDLAGGRGGDLIYLYHSGFTNVFAVDNDREALVQYVTRSVKTPYQEHKFLNTNCVDRPKTRTILLNAIYHELCENDEPLIHEINSRFEKPKDGFDLVLMNFAIHYLFYSKKAVEEVFRVAQQVLKPGGKFIISYYDGDLIREQSKNNELKLKSFTIKIIDEIKALMPLPTIDESGYREEPLVRKDWLTYQGLTLEKSFNPVGNTSHIRNAENVVDFMNFIRVNVYVRN